MIRTLTGNITTPITGNILTHEHLRCVSNDMLHTFGKRWLDESFFEDYTTEILTEAKRRYNVEVFVDGTPWDLGRDVRFLKRVSERSGVKLVASSGLYFHPSMLTSSRTAEEICDLILEECNVGMEGTGIKPGILKCAAEQTVDCETALRIRAVAMAGKETGLPIYVHSSHLDGISEKQMEILEECGVSPEKAVLGHASRRMDADYLESILNRGYCIGIDRSFDGSEKRVAEVVAELCRRGYSKKLLFSHDLTIYNDFNRGNNTGIKRPASDHIARLGFLYERLIPEFEKVGIDEKTILDFTRNNAFDFIDIKGD